jgi:hypothetical protein
MSLDLLDRKGKYSNGFCHWPQPAWLKADGSWQPTVTHFTSLADPAAIGSGLTGLTTLMHEAGHAAHPTLTLILTLTLTLILTYLTLTLSLALTRRATRRTSPTSACPRRSSARSVPRPWPLFEP